MWYFTRRRGTPKVAVISSDCHSKLPEPLRSRFHPAPPTETATHVVGSSENELFALVAVDVLAEMATIDLGSANWPTENFSIPDSSAEAGGDFGGGDGGAAGAGDDW